MSAKDIANFKSIEAQRSNNPDKGLRDLFASTKINPASYYRGRKLALGGPAKRQGAKVAAATKAPKAKEPNAPTPLATATSKYGQMILLIGTPEQMRQALNGQL